MQQATEPRLYSPNPAPANSQDNIRPSRTAENHHPHAWNLQRVAACFDKAHADYPGIVDIRQDFIVLDPERGALACPAGHFVLAMINNPWNAGRFRFIDGILNDTLPGGHPTGPPHPLDDPDANHHPVEIHWSAGADLLATMLGFDDGLDGNPMTNLTDWARANPQFWGNNRGPDMFRDPGAYCRYDSISDPVVTVPGIACWFRGVATRVPDQVNAQWLAR